MAAAMTDDAPVLLITGAARRLGASIATLFHQRGYRVVVHYHRSGEAAAALADTLCRRRSDSAIAVSAALTDLHRTTALPKQVIDRFGRLDVLINNASSFYPTPWGQVDECAWDDLFASNLRGPFFLSQACLPELRHSGGCIINLIDVYADRPLADHPVYCIAKAGLAMMTRSLARDSGVRSNGIAPGTILWPEGGHNDLDDAQQAAILANIPMGRIGEPLDIARCAWFLANEAPYVNGQIIAVDGGRSQVG